VCPLEPILSRTPPHTLPEARVVPVSRPVGRLRGPPNIGEEPGCPSGHFGRKKIGVSQMPFGQDHVVLMANPDGKASSRLHRVPPCNVMVNG